MQIIADNNILKDEIYIINSKIKSLYFLCKTIFDLKIEEKKKTITANINIICIFCTSTNNNIEEVNDNIFNSPEQP